MAGEHIGVVECFHNIQSFAASFFKIYDSVEKTPVSSLCVGWHVDRWWHMFRLYMLHVCTQPRFGLVKEVE